MGIDVRLICGKIAVMSESIFIEPEECEHFKVVETGQPLTEMFPHGIFATIENGEVKHITGEPSEFPFVSMKGNPDNSTAAGAKLVQERNDLQLEAIRKRMPF